MSIIIEALRAARDMISTDRQSFVDCLSLPGGTLDAEDATIRDEYDAVLAQIDVAIQDAGHEINRLRADAARYAYLRDHMLHGVSHPHGSAIGMSEVLFGDDPDEAIDAAMKEKRK